MSETTVIVVLESVPAARENRIVAWLSRAVERVGGWVNWSVDGLFGLLSLLLLLAVLAAIPLLNVVSLGAMLQAQGAVGRTGQWRRALPLIGPARQLGHIVVGMLLWLAPLSLLGGWTADAKLIDPDSPATKILQLLTLAAAVLVTLQILTSLARGGSVGIFCSPWRNFRWVLRGELNRAAFERMGIRMRTFLTELEIGQHFRLGLLGILGVLCWTVIPTTLYAVAETNRGPAVLVTLIGGGLLTIVMSWMPVMQARYAARQQWSVFRDLRSTRQLFAQAPLLWTLVLLLGYGMSLLLYLFKIVAPPRDAVWLMTIFFIALIYPARILTGWVHAWAESRPDRPWWGWRWMWGFVSLALSVIYVFLLFFTRNIGANGKLVLYEQPFLLIPAPF